MFGVLHYDGVMYTDREVSRCRERSMSNQWPPTGPPLSDDWWPSFPWIGRPDLPIAMTLLGHPVSMAALWCRATRTEAHSYYQAALRCDWANWAIEKAEDWSPTGDQFSRYVERLWVTGCQLIMAADQAHVWARRAFDDVEEIPHLRNTRNSIVHLDNADMDEEYATASTGDGRAWSLEKLPEGHLIMGMASDPLNTVFGAVSLDAIVQFAERYQHADNTD